MSVTNSSAEVAAQNDKAQAEGLLREVRASLTGFELAHAPAPLEQLAALRLTASQALELQAFQILVRSLGDDARPDDLLMHAKRLQVQAQAEHHPMAQAAAWRALQWIQGRMRLHHAALDSVARAGELYQRCGQEQLALQMQAIRCTVLFGSEMYLELRLSCAELLARPADLTPPVHNLLLNYAASAAYYLALEEDDAGTAAPYWRDCLAQRELALQVARRHRLHYHEGLALLNLAVVKATLGQPDDCREYLTQFHQCCGPQGVQPYWRLGLRLCEVLMQCVEGSRSDAWQALLAFDAELALEPPHSTGSREIVAYAIRHYGRLWGYLEETLQACMRQVQVERRHKRELATSLGATINAVMERPQLLHQNAQLAQHGTALENSLVQRNAELSAALDQLRQEVDVRQAAEAALRRAHDELEQQVRERTAALEQAMRSLMAQEKQLGLSRMVVGMAHELNTPVGNARMAASAIAAQAEELQHSLDDGSLRRSQLQALLEHLLQGGQLLDRAIVQINRLVERFKGLSSHPEQEPLCRFDLGALLRASAIGWQPRLLAQGVTLAFTLPGQLWMSGYPGACGLIFQQLLDNSLFHGFRGGSGGTIAVAASIEDQTVQIRWRDDGCGIAADQLPKVFEPFFTTQLGTSGTGLGLASVHSLVVDLMQGTVAIDSAPGAGTEVVLRLPAGAL